MAVAWLVVAAVVGLLVGRMIRERDRQVPGAPDAPAPGAREGTRPRVVGRGRQRRR
ncbi:hypothetical protein [Pseudonocardia kunmingensis]|uniref:Uncharacterized protein n=1 Tax=Pseudonocardia kunmingensis TaxID=630975 RepID=A0A543E2C2_9PSEU|nr:hypothetical protein [Pseudonocardia kunmingensis]TQM15734.1 hypothetical protein FB558_2525 [Pseudonocardia kunmingensis]